MKISEYEPSKNIKNIFAWRVTPTHYRLKGTEFKKPEWIKGE